MAITRIAPKPTANLKNVLSNISLFYQKINFKFSLSNKKKAAHFVRGFFGGNPLFMPESWHTGIKGR
jgi:hypothetical protein